MSPLTLVSEFIVPTLATISSAAAKLPPPPPRITTLCYSRGKTLLVICQIQMRNIYNNYLSKFLKI